MNMIRRVAQVVVAIGIVALILLVQVEVEGAKTFAVTSSTPDGKDFIAQNSVRYIANTYGMPFANFSVDDGRIAANVNESTTWRLKTGLRFNVTYVPLSDELVRKHALRPALSVWDRYGGWCILGLFLLAAFIVSRPSRQTGSP
jgi:hypothetical protein